MTTPRRVGQYPRASPSNAAVGPHHVTTAGSCVRQKRRQHASVRTRSASKSSGWDRSVDDDDDDDGSGDTRWRSCRSWRGSVILPV